MPSLDLTSPWLIAGLVFCFRILDVSIGTMRTINVIRGYSGIAMVLGFVEVTIWVFAVTPVVIGLPEHPWLAVAFAGGFAAGNAVGIALERRLALGTVVVRMISRRPPSALTGILGDAVSGVAAFEGYGRDGSRTLLYASCPRRNLPDLLARVRADEPDLFYVVERFSQVGLTPLPHPTGWRAVFKKK